MKTPVITFMVKKGGTGKTTTAFFSAVGLCQRGHRVLVIDADQQRSAVLWSNTARERGVAHVPTCVEAPNLYRLEQAVAQKDQYDVVIIDTASNYVEGYVEIIGAAMAASDFAVLPLKPGHLEYSALKQTFEVLQTRWEVINDEVPRPMVLRNLWEYTNKAQGIEKDLIETGLPMFDTKLFNRTDFAQGVFEGVTALHGDEYRKTYGHTPSAKCLQEAQDYITELEQWVELEVCHGGV